MESCGAYRRVGAGHASSRRSQVAHVKKKKKNTAQTLTHKNHPTVIFFFFLPALIIVSDISLCVELMD